MFDYSNLNEKHELFGKRNIKKHGKTETETPKHIWIDEFFC